jgi:ribose/xylose/arabinose/galactoside ABC-type transport system permease subunit
LSWRQLDGCAVLIGVFVSGNGGLDLSVGPAAGFVTVVVAASLEPANVATPSYPKARR